MCAEITLLQALLCCLLGIAVIYFFICVVMLCFNLGLSFCVLALIFSNFGQLFLFCVVINSLFLESPKYVVLNLF